MKNTPLEILFVAFAIAVGCNSPNPPADGMNVIRDRDDAAPMATCTEFHSKVCDGDIESVLAMIKSGADVNRLDSKGEPPLFRLFWVTELRENHIRVVEALVKNGADVNWAHPVTGDTALHEAAFACKKPLVKALLDLGAKLHVYNKAGLLPIHKPIAYCMSSDVIDVMELLCSHGASYTDRTQSGETCFEYAKRLDCTRAHEHMARHLKGHK